jgi:hypothetical protein
MLGLEKRGFMSRQLSRLADCIDRGLALVEPQLAQILDYSSSLAQVDACPRPSNGPAELRRETFVELLNRYVASPDPIYLHIGTTMLSFEQGLFAGGDLPLPQDNLELERFFKRPKRHQRHIHGTAHAGSRLVAQGPTLIPTLDAHLRDPNPLPPEALIPYRNAPVPSVQLQAIERRAVMRRARSPKKRPLLLQQLEQLYLEHG